MQVYHKTPHIFLFTIFRASCLVKLIYIKFKCKCITKRRGGNV